MRVAIVTRFPKNPDTPRGGVESVSVNLVRALAKLPELKIEVVTTSRECKEPVIADWNGVPIHRLPMRGRTMLSDAIGPGRRTVSNYLLKMCPDLVHAHDTYGLLVKGLPLPRVFTVHGFIYGDTLVSQERFSKLRSRIWEKVETSGWADQPYIISISPYVRERLSGIAKGVIRDIDNPISDVFFHVPRAEEKGVIFSAASIMPRKNTLSLIEAFIRLLRSGVDAKLRLAGPVLHAGYSRQVEQRIQESGFADRIALLGKLSTEQVIQELSRAAVFALVSLEENSPMAIEEAMAAGVPVLSSNRCGMPYMVRHGETGYLVDPSDSGEIAHRLQELLSSDELRRNMAEKAKTIALDRFHAAGVARRTLDVYKEALRASGERVSSSLGYAARTL